MRKLFRSLLSLSLAMAIALTFTPMNAVAASYPQITVASEGLVKAVYYAGGSFKNAGYSIITNQLVDSDSGYDVYDVRIIINRPTFGKNEVIKVVNDLKKKKTDNFRDFMPVVINNKGTELDKGIKFKGKIDTENCSGHTRYRVKSKNTTYKLNVRNHIEYSFKLYVKDGKKNVYVGIAGIRNGQLTENTYKQYVKNKINYYKAGYGNIKSGYIVAVKIS